MLHNVDGTQDFLRYENKCIKFKSWITWNLYSLASDLNDIENCRVRTYLVVTKRYWWMLISTQSLKTLSLFQREKQLFTTRKKCAICKTRVTEDRELVRREGCLWAITIVLFYPFVFCPEEAMPSEAFGLVEKLSMRVVVVDARVSSGNTLVVFLWLFCWFEFLVMLLYVECYKWTHRIWKHYIEQRRWCENQNSP